MIPHALRPVLHSAFDDGGSRSLPRRNQMKAGTLHGPRFLLLALPLIAAGCKTNPHADFQPLQQNISARTGSTPEWPRSAEDSKTFDARVTQLLADELMPATAVQIALLNNRSLRATFEEIGISRAELLQASLPRNPEFFASFRFPDRPPSAADTEFSITGDIMDHAASAPQTHRRPSVRAGQSSVAADPQGNVYVTWHVPQPGNTIGEAGRAVFIARSTDEGKTLNRETPAISLKEAPWQFIES